MTDKLTKAAANYRKTEDVTANCHVCVHRIPHRVPASQCEVVQGDVESDATCDYFKAFDTSTAVPLPTWYKHQGMTGVVELVVVDADIAPKVARLEDGAVVDVAALDHRPDPTVSSRARAVLDLFR
jgi:hypothetical protein